MNGTAAEQRAIEDERERCVSLTIGIAAALIETHLDLALAGNPDALGWMQSERFDACWEVIGAHPTDPDIARAALLDPDDETDPDEPVGNALRDRGCMRELVVSGMSQRDMARHLGVSKRTVAKWLTRHRLTTVRCGRRRAAEAA